ncbi:MAG: sigma factor G inhibitor Gin [Bacillus sp. (in: firmicutes)]
MNLSLLKEQKPVGEKCLVCESYKSRGIHLYLSFICSDCEQAIVHTKTSDMNYSFYINRLKEIRIS